MPPADSFQSEAGVIERSVAILGVEQNISQEATQKAYRKLAKKLHPDLNPGDKQAEEKFKEVSAGYDLLGDADKRAQFDRGEIDGQGTEQADRQHFYCDFADQSYSYANDTGFADFAGAESIFSLLRSRGSHQRPHARLGCSL